MAKRGSRRGKPRKAQATRRELYRGLYEADKLMRSEKYLEARGALEELDRKFPDNEDVLRGLTEACHGLRDTHGYQHAVERLSKLAQDDRDVVLGLAGAYMTNLKPTMALRGFRRFLELWPNDERAAQVVETIATLKRVVSERLSALGFSEEEFDELGAMHDETQVLMEYGQYAEARRVAEKLIERKPMFAAVNNNLSITYAMEGDLKSAIAVAHGTIESERGGDKAAASAASRHFDQHPELKALVPILLDRGDPVGREFAMRLASLVKMPETLAALRDFALGQRGPDQMRFRAAQIAREEGLLPEGPVRLWTQGKWREIIQTTNEIHFEPLFKHRPEVSKLLAKGIERMREGDGVESERLFKQALELVPDSPDILNNLAAAYSLQGRLDESDRLIRQIHQQHSDYLFGITNLAKIHIYNSEFDEAAELLKPLMSRKRMHHDELIAIIETNVQLHMAKNDPEKARAWLNMWEQVEPEHPRLQEWRLQIEIKNIPESLRRYLERNSQR